MVVECVEVKRCGVGGGSGVWRMLVWWGVARPHCEGSVS